MGQTLTQKIIARACVTSDSGRDCNGGGGFADWDASGPHRCLLEELGAQLWDPSKVVSFSDHYVPAVDAQSAEILHKISAASRAIME
jgi:3-isopropylmalate/(R)-2-methylmalate dehydratase large subunit